MARTKFASRVDVAGNTAWKMTSRALRRNRIVVQNPSDAEEKELLADTNVSSILGEVADWYVFLDFPWLKLPQRREVEVTGELGTEEWGGRWLVARRPRGSSKPPRECREEMEEVGGEE